MTDNMRPPTFTVIPVARNPRQLPTSDQTQLTVLRRQPRACVITRHQNE